MLDELLNLDNKKLLDYINNCSYEEKKELLSNDKVKEKFILSEYDYPFIWLVQSLKKEELELFLDEKGIDILINSNKLNHKLNALITLDNDVNYEVLSNDKIITKIYKYYNELSSFMKYSQVQFVEKFYQYIVQNKLDFSYLFCFQKNLPNILKKHIDEIIEKNLITENSIDKLDKTSISELTNYEYFKNMILNPDYSLNKFDKLILNDNTFNEDILIDERFIKKMLEHKDVSSYRFLINKLLENNNIMYVNDIDKKRDKYYDEIINSYNSKTGMFREYEELFSLMVKDNLLLNQEEFFHLDIGSKINKKSSYDINIIYFDRNKSDIEKIEAIKNIFIELTKSEFNEILIDRYYKEIPYNFLINLNNLINFNESNLSISKENMETYQKIKNCYDNKEIDVDFYNSLKNNSNLVSQFYDDFSNSKKVSYKLIKDSLVEVDEIEKQKNLEESKDSGVDIYDFNGENFYLLIHNTSIHKNSENIDNVFNSNKIKNGTSLSLISNRRMDYFNDYDDSIVLGFNDINVNYISHLYNSDSFSYCSDKNNVVSNRITKLYTPETFIEDTNGYNEIVYRIKDSVNKENQLHPSYVIAFDKVNEFDIKVAKKFNIPIIKIDKEKYKDNLLKSSVYNSFSDDDNYIDSYVSLQNKTL